MNSEAQLTVPSLETFDTDAAAIETTCVIVGAGACGLVAALRLAHAGVDCIVLERDASPSGSTSMSSGFIPAAGTHLQRSLGIDDSAELLATDIQRKARQQVDPALLAALTRRSGDVIDWLADAYGLEWVVLQDFLYPGHTTHRMHAVPEKTGAALQQRLLTALHSTSQTLVTSTRAEALVVDDTGAVRGVRVRYGDGSTELIHAANTILACNGYGANQALLSQHIPELAGVHYHGHAGNTGDAMLWAQLLDVPLLQMSAYQGHGSLASGHNILISWALMMAGGVQVNREGVRFSNEHGGYSEQAQNVHQQPGSVAWNIYDARLHQLGLDFPDYREAQDAGAVVTAETLDALAAQLGLPLPALERTMEAVVALAAAEAVDEFGRQFIATQQLAAPWYAIKVIPALFHTQGGLAIDTGAHVLRDNGTVVRGLYAAGGAAVGVSGESVSGYLSGNGLLSAVGFGAIAADSVTAAVESDSKRGAGGCTTSSPVRNR